MSTAKDPAILFYTSDFLSGVYDLTMEERGQYITLLCIQHQKGVLTEKTIRLSVGSASDYVLSKFEQDENGNYYNVRLREEIEKRKKFIESRRQNGKLGGRPRKANEKLMKTYRLSVAKPNDKLTETDRIPVGLAAKDGGIYINTLNTLNNKEEEKELRSIVCQFYDYQSAHFPLQLREYKTKPDKLIRDSIKELERLIRIDGVPVEQIKTTLRSAVNDEFWRKQVISLRGIRKKGKNGLTKFANMHTSLSKSDPLEEFING